MVPIENTFRPLVLDIQETTRDGIIDSKIIAALLVKGPSRIP